MTSTPHYQMCVILMVSFPWPSVRAPGYLIQILRNRDRLQAYQREYSRRKRAPGRRKVSKAERALLEEQHKQKHQFMAMEDLLPCSKAAFGPCVCPSPLLSFGPYAADMKGLCMLTHCTITSSRSSMKSRHDRRGRKGSGLL